MSVSEIGVSKVSGLIENRRRLIQTGSYYLAFIALGSVAASMGPTLSGLAEHTDKSLSQMGILFTVRSIGALLGALLGSRLYDHLSGNRVMVAMLITMLLTMSLVPLMPLLWLLCLVMLVLGFAEITLDLGGNTLLVWVHGRRVAPFMNGLHFFFGVGAFLSPIIIAQAVLISGDIVWAYWALALLLVPVAGWLMRLPSPARRSPVDEGVGRRGDFIMVVPFVLFFFLYVGAEIAFGGWIFSYAVTLNLAGETMAAYLTSGFFGAFTLGRLISIPLVARFRPKPVLFGDLVGCLLSLGLIVVWPTRLLALWLGTLGLGLSMASVFPTLYSMAERRMSISGQVSGFFFVGASLGSMSIPWLVGQLFEVLQPEAMMVCLFVVLALALVLLVIYSRFEGTGTVAD